MKITSITRMLQYRYYGRLIAAFLAAAILPGVAMAAGGYGLVVLAEATPPAPASQEQLVEFLANKNVSYWFIALAVTSITSWSFIVKWLIKQLELQRAANQETTNKLITYMEKDHAAMVAVVGEVSATQKQTALILERVLRKLEEKDS